MVPIACIFFRRILHITWVLERRLHQSYRWVWRKVGCLWMFQKSSIQRLQCIWYSIWIGMLHIIECRKHLWHVWSINRVLECWYRWGLVSRRLQDRWVTSFQENYSLPKFFQMTQSINNIIHYIKHYSLFEDRNVTMQGNVETTSKMSDTHKPLFDKRWRIDDFEKKAKNKIQGILKIEELVHTLYNL